MNKILLVIADENYRNRLTKEFVDGGYTVVAGSVEDDLQRLIKDADPDLLLIDGHIIESFSLLARDFPKKPVIAWMNERNARLAVTLISEGARECLCPPIESFEVLEVVRHVMRQVNGKDTPAPQPLPRPKREYRPLVKKIALFSGVALAVAALFMVSFSASSIKTFTLVGQNPTGICWMKNQLLTSDWYTQSVYVYTIGSSLKLKKIISFPEFGPNAVAVVDDLLWVSGTDGNIHTYNVVKNTPMKVSTLKAPGYSPSGLCSQQRYLWSVDAETCKIYQHHLSDPDRIAAVFDYPGKMPVGFYWDGKYFWSADGKANKVYRHRGPESNFQISDSYALGPDGGGVIAGMSGDGKNLWLIYNGPPTRVLRYPISKLEK